ncbi:hypothetical protein K7X08_029835 [Anisodus acutangulus]|uniref:Uncharacterized protein n=1 Tax=Anisodus acutangulus TaxID=402998 RepID=A0A9Q1M4Y5_9SOLA|nr:hypothetical protein K7X08_029835 [Anisodus acutangulus]
MRKVESSGSYLALLLLLVVSTTGTTEAAGLFIFGDSTVDAGNNNYIQTVPENRANHKPYAQNGFFHQPTGRFSDGRIIVDFIAEHAKLPLIPPYLQPNADFSNGVNFASGGAGVLSTTHPGLVIDLERQLKHFEEVCKSLTEKMGAAKAEELVSEAVYFISIGSNDYLGGYFDNETMQQLHGPEDYLGMVVGNLTQAIQELYEKGARKFGFLSLSPLGCLPALRALNPNEEAAGGCFQAASDLALAHNNALTIVLTSLQHILQGFKYCNSNFYDWLLDRVNNPAKYGFKEGMKACCGAGPYGGINACGGTKKVTDYHLCDDAKEYIWFDAFHPTEGIHEQFAKALWDGPSSSVGPYTLQNLFFGKEKQTIADIVDI